MDTTAVVGWLNSVFAPFDLTILGAFHQLAQVSDFLFTPLFEVVSLLGEKGLCFFAFAGVLMLFKRTRWTGICLLVAVCLGALVTNIVLKDLIARPRPFESSETYTYWWHFVGAPAEDGFSFPSGHMTAAAAAMSAWAIVQRNVRAVIVSVVVVALMGCARCYLLAHYPTDVLAGCVVGVFSAVCAVALVRAAQRQWQYSRTKGKHRVYGQNSD